MNVWICTDMEGLAGVDSWEQCYAEDDNDPGYRYACEQLTLEVNAAVAGCFDGGATRVFVLDGHGRNRNKGFIAELLDPRVEKVWIDTFAPIRFEGLNESIDAVAIIGQHSMAGTINGFLDHTQSPKSLCRFVINWQEHGEMSQFAYYAGHYDIPLVFASGDEALCAEAHRLFPGVVTTPTKRGTGWATCELYPADEVRENIRRDIATALRAPQLPAPAKIELPATLLTEWAYSAFADGREDKPHVTRVNARTLQWTINDARDVYSWQ
jgi:D-amino peptidase